MTVVFDENSYESILGRYDSEESIDMFGGHGIVPETASLHSATSLSTSLRRAAPEPEKRVRFDSKVSYAGPAQADPADRETEHGRRHAAFDQQDRVLTTHATEIQGHPSPSNLSPSHRHHRPASAILENTPHERDLRVGPPPDVDYKYLEQLHDRVVVQVRVRHGLLPLRLPSTTENLRVLILLNYLHRALTDKEMTTVRLNNLQSFDEAEKAKAVRRTWFGDVEARLRRGEGKSENGCSLRWVDFLEGWIFVELKAEKVQWKGKQEDGFTLVTRREA
ncbi:hypothetical protein V5O48_017582 [Marasmius crinis-equi]|uniref:Uncharacterized protein n=1 Tax=Marasmius crinis-equi TaxID=585013 RepID=A0ABR3ENJ8_9AGAR